MMQNSKLFLLSLSVIALGSGCSKSSSSSSTSSTTSSIQTLVGSIASAVQTAGDGMATSATRSNLLASLLTAPSLGSSPSMLTPSTLTPSICDEHGSPNLPSGYSDGRYPGAATYCFLTKDTGDTVLGGFSLAKKIGCILDSINPQYDGQAHSVTVTPGDCMAGEDEVPASMTATITASSPAVFNSNFSKGVVLELSELGLVFKIAFNSSSTASSFITEENWTGDSTYKGASAGSLDVATGDLRFESRFERMDCETNGSCGWNRHTRVYASLDIDSSGNPSGLNSISFAHSNITSTPGQSNFGGLVITSEGDLSTGIKSRLWSTSDGSISTKADYKTFGNWIETSNALCFTSLYQDAESCTSGLSFTDSDISFLLAGGHLDLDTWFGNRSTQTYTSIDLSSETE